MLVYLFIVAITTSGNTVIVQRSFANTPQCKTVEAEIKQDYSRMNYRILHNSGCLK